MNLTEALVQAQIDLARMRRERDADKPKNARQDPAQELLEMRKRVNSIS